MSDPIQAFSLSLSSSRVMWDPAPEDDLASIQRYLMLGLDAVNLGINLYRWPLEETFARPACTIRLLPGSAESARSQQSPLAAGAWDVQHQVNIGCYHTDRQKTVDLGTAVTRLLRDGLPGTRPLSIPIFSQALGVVVARSLRAVRPSLAMGVEATDDEGKWVVNVGLTVTSPRLRNPSVAPTLEHINSTVTHG